VTDRSFREAVGEALAAELERDPTVVLLGEDITLGGVFNTTSGLVERFGRERVIDTPISELAFTGAAVFAAIRGLRPVVEIMFADFLALVMDTLQNQASKYWYVSNNQASVPLVVRTAVGGGGRFGACHSQTPTSMVLGEPGLKLIAPSNAVDAKQLLRAAIQDDNPVVFFEHKLLYGRKDELPADDAPVEPLGRAAVARGGGDVTIAAAMAAVETALEAAESLAADGIEAEVIDLRSLRPLDVETIAESASKTRRLVVVEEGPAIGGYAAEVVASAVEGADSLRARRVTMPDHAIPFSPLLEDASLPAPAAVADAARDLLS
jgi:pyruvate/2-oxoglutarate/acetoin dehydrogenase E1 component